jgi:hypothetical protein
MGSPGGNGLDGGSGVCANCVAPGCSGSGCGVASTTKTCGQDGLSGCGGPGGLPGGGAGGGGSSIVLFAWDAHVTCNGTTLTAGAGGAGGPGGTGGDGGGGSAGAAGTGAGTCGTTVPAGLLCLSGCTTTSNPVTMSGGGAGGAGAAGGTGGTGGGGAGGWSCAYYLGGAAVMTPSGSSFNHGAMGTGGAPGGANGVQQQKCP